MWRLPPNLCLKLSPKFNFACHFGYKFRDHLNLSPSSPKFLPNLPLNLSPKYIFEGWTMELCATNMLAVMY